MRMYLAGFESRPQIAMEVQPPYILFTYASVYGSKRTGEKLMQCVKSDWCKDYLVDSGAFSFSATGYGGSKTNVEWEKYVDSFADFINTWDVRHFFELDIDGIVGLQKVEELRGRLERRTGKQPIPVWHKNRGWKYFERMCDEYQYVSIGGVAKNPNGPRIVKTFPYFIQYAHKHGCQIHGLGYTDIKNLKNNPFDSTDSTSWNSGSRYGVTFEMRGHALVGHKNIFPDKKVDGKTIDVHNCKVWAQYARSIDL